MLGVVQHRGSKPEQGKGGTHEGGRWPFGVSEEGSGWRTAEQGVTAEWSEAMSVREWAARAAGARWKKGSALRGKAVTAMGTCSHTKH